MFVCKSCGESNRIRKTFKFCPYCGHSDIIEIEANGAGLETVRRICGQIQKTASVEASAIIVPVDIDTAQIDEAEQKANRLCEKIKEAKSLADNLASTEINLNVSIL